MNYFLIFLLVCFYILLQCKLLTGCEGDPQPCDVTRFGCCPDGYTEARGTYFEGCLEILDDLFDADGVRKYSFQSIKIK